MELMEENPKPFTVFAGKSHHEDDGAYYVYNHVFFRWEILETKPLFSLKLTFSHLKMDGCMEDVLFPLKGRFSRPFQVRTCLLF